jgi:D-glycero-D-manno-heptose 1,7-bisphosphate phosphatase
MDRDGVINENAEPGQYIRRWEDFKLIPATVEWIRLFNALDLLVIVVTNQRGVALGHLTANELGQIHENMCKTLASQGAHIDDVFSCPHAKGACDCRKPQPGLVLRAAAKWNIALGESLMIGDSVCDQELAHSCGLRFLRVSSGRIVRDLDHYLTV